jgi:hypothetical protein
MFRTLRVVIHTIHDCLCECHTVWHTLHRRQARGQFLNPGRNLVELYGFAVAIVLLDEHSVRMMLYSRCLVRHPMK